VALIHTKKNITNNNFIAKQIEPSNILKGLIQPPKNNITIIEDINIILAYSAKKKKVNPIEEYSTYNPKLIHFLLQVNQMELY
jgi:hypothetical protein